VSVAVSVARVPDRARTALYRGWMLTPHQYSAMHGVLAARETHLLSTPDAYRTCHYLPESHPFIAERTPRSVWFPVDRARGLDLETLRAAIAPFGDSPLVVKDYVKSHKHAWEEACFIPRASDLPEVLRVASRFLKLQGEDLNEGLVFRAFVPLRMVGMHPKSGMPLAAEFRIFWLDGEPLLSHRYWGELGAPEASPVFDAPLPMAELRTIAARIPSRFFTMDIAFLEDGSWTIVDLGDGQVAGLPAPELSFDFYRGLAKGLG